MWREQFSTRLTSLQTPEPSSRTLRPPTNSGVPTISSGWIISWNNSQNSGDFYIYDYSSIIKDTVRTSQMQRHIGWDLRGSQTQNFHVLRMHYPPSMLMLITNQETQSELSIFLAVSVLDYTQSLISPEVGLMSLDSKPQPLNHMVGVSSMAGLYPEMI